MEINFIEKTKYRIMFEIKGVDHTFCNMLKNELWNNSDVKACSYRTKHPLISIPTFIVETSKNDAIKEVLDAIKKIESENKKFLTALKKA